MASLLHPLLSLPALWVYVIVAVLVFTEDAVFVGFVIPGEIAAVLAGVDAHAGHLSLAVAVVVVVLAAIAGDSVGYQVGRKVGTRALQWRLLARRRRRIDEARERLAHRGGAAVFLGRFVSFFRAVMPALAGMSHMPYRRFLPWNAVGGAVWGTTFVLVGYLAGASWQKVTGTVGTGAAVAVGVVAVVVLAVWQVRRRRRGADLSRPEPT